MVRKRKNGHDWLTPTEAARLCGLSHMTIIRRFDAGDLKGYRVPGSRFRRIPRKSLMEFAARYSIPLPGAAGRGRGGEGDGEPAGGRRALVVEDERRMADLLEKVLKADGWAVTVARNGFDAGFRAASLRPDLILLDIMLPGLDGREACRQLRADPHLAGARILAVTALSDEGSVDEIFDAGVDGYLSKPFSLDALRAKIAELTAVEDRKVRDASVVKTAAEMAE